MKKLFQFIEELKKTIKESKQRREKHYQAVSEFLDKKDHTDADYIKFFQQGGNYTLEESKEMLELVNEIAEVRANYYKLRRRVMKKNHPELYEKLKKKKMLHHLLRR